MIKLNTVVNQDCFLGMKEMDNESVDLILTDPPYGIKYQNNYSFNKHRKIKGDEGIDYDEFSKECYRVLKNNSHAYFFTRFDEYPAHYMALQKAGFIIKNCLVVEKGNIGGCGDLKGSYANNSEWIIFCVKGKRNFEETKLVKNKKSGVKTNSRGGVASEYKTRLPSCWFGDEYPKSTYNSSWQKANNVMHPTIKNSDCLSWLIQISSKEGDVVFDPFGGSGSTFVSAIKTRRRFYGFEIDEQYYNLCIKRIEEERNQLEEKTKIIIPKTFVSFGNRVTLRKNSYTFKARKENNYWIANDTYLGISCVGNNIEEISDDFKENLLATYKLYVECNEDELDSHALQLRQKVKEVISSVEASN